MLRRNYEVTIKLYKTSYKYNTILHKQPIQNSYLQAIPYFHRQFNTKSVSLSKKERMLSIRSVRLPIEAQVLCLCKLNKAQRPTMRPQAFLGISSYKEKRDAWRKSEYGNSHLWWQICQRAVLMLFMTFYAFLIISVHKTCNFLHFSQKHYRHTDGRTDRRTDGRTHPLIEMRGRI